MSKILVAAIGLILFTAAVRHESYWENPPGWPEPSYDFSANPMSAEKIALGRRLFYDEILSADNSVSCASCHSPYNAFAHTDHTVSHGIHDRFGTRNAPGLQNLAWQDVFMWDGAIHYLDQQALAPISHPDEMGEDIAHVVYKLSRTEVYPGLFKSAFGDTAITGERTLKAISQFLLTLVSAGSRYDSVQQHLARFTRQEANGEELFNRHCNSCHSAPLFRKNSFENNGLSADTSRNDAGRMKVTGKSEDYLRFKIPTLRNIAYTAPYMHDGRFRRLSDVLNHYSTGITESPTLSKELRNRIPLNSDQKADLIAFLLTLSDRRFLFDTSHTDPRIPRQMQ
jgi:cytochrome c peroxidase